MPNYQKGKIYKITSESTSMIYIGSTVKTLYHRFQGHKTEHNLQIKNISSSELLQYPDCKIELLENYPCDTKEELLEREQYYMDINRPICVNALNASGEDILKKRERDIRYKAKNFDKLVAKEKQRRAERMVCMYCDREFCKGAWPDHVKRKIHLDNVEIFDKILEEFDEDIDD